jgi:hypothetical protein
MVLGSWNKAGAIAHMLFQAWSEGTPRLVVLVVELNRNVGHGYLVFLGVPCIMNVDKKRWWLLVTIPAGKSAAYCNLFLKTIVLPYRTSPRWCMAGKR